MGGILAMEIIKKVPDRVMKIVLMDTNYKSETAEIKSRRLPQIKLVNEGLLDDVMCQQIKNNYLRKDIQNQEIFDLCLSMANDLGKEIFINQSKALSTRKDYKSTLENIKVLDLTRAAAGPFCTMILGDLGADVVKVEPTPKGDMTRLLGPYDHGIGVYYLSINRNKRCLGIDFRNEDGLETLRRMAVKADVVVENFKPGTADDMGLGYDDVKALNPKVIYGSISGLGRTGPYGSWPGLDQIAQGMSGMMSLPGQQGGEPTRYGVPFGDFTAGMWCALAVTAAVAQRHVTGEQQRLKLSLKHN